MSDEGEKTCPLCAEEMDLTDQQLKPCKCGYQVCVWCWHHIMDMAEKDETEGRCPACRTPYNKEKIVGTTAKCERLVSELNVEKKLKSHKGKSKTSEGRKQLGSVRVIQRNLVYVVGLPLNFADEDLLQRREYFCQYGKVLKVSISRTAAGAIQQFSNSTCNVYITYSKEEEAVRCIQSVHGFILDGRPLKACYGTTKYCHAWLRNVPCSNPDCLYLHEIGSQEDSFTKDEIVSAYTRSRVQQITSSSKSTQLRSGNVLPPPADEYCNNSSASSAKPIIKTAINTNGSAVSARVSPPNTSSGRSAALPAGASWGTRASNNQSLPSNAPSLKQKPDSCNGPVAFSKAVASTAPVSSFHGDAGKKLVPDAESTISRDNNKMGTFESLKRELTKEKFTASEISVAPLHPTANSPINGQPHSPPTDKPTPNTTNRIDSSILYSGPVSDKNSIDDTDGNMENVCSDISSRSIHENQQLQNGNVEHIRELQTYQTSGEVATTTEKIHVTSIQDEFRLRTLPQEPQVDLHQMVASTEKIHVTSIQDEFRLGKPIQEPQVDLHQMEDDLLSFDKQRIKDPEIATSRDSDFLHSFHLAKPSSISSQLNNVDGLDTVNLHRQVVDRNNKPTVSTSDFPGRHHVNMNDNRKGNSVECSNLVPTEENSLLERYEREVASDAPDIGESCIISNILSLDFDPWDESLTSPQNLAKLLGETDKRQASFGVPGQRRVQANSQSRFSFAREEEPVGHVPDFGRSIEYFEEILKHDAAIHDFSRRNSFHQEKFVSSNGFPAFSGVESDIFATSHSHISSNKISVSRSQISAPPGFSTPIKAPPPGFTCHEKKDQYINELSGNHVLDNSSLLRNQYRTPSSGNAYNNGDIAFMDPAILAVGKGTVPGGINIPSLDARTSFSPQLSSTYEEAALQSFLQRSVQPHQNQRYMDLGKDNFSNGYAIPSRVMDQMLSNNPYPFSQFTLPQPRNGMAHNGPWDGWTDAKSGNNLGMADLLRNESLGFNKFYSGYEDSKIRMPSSGNLYNGTYGI